MRAVREYGPAAPRQQWLRTNVSVLGLDETAFLAATATSLTRFVTGLVDLRPAGGGPARLLDIVLSGTGILKGRWMPDRSSRR